MKINKHKRIITLAIGVIFTVAVSKAQDVGQTIIDNAASTQYNYMTSHIANLSLKNASGNAGAKSGRDLSYNPSPRIKSRVINNMAVKLKLDAANTAKLKQTDVDGIFTGITKPYNLKYDDAADIVTAYQALNWMIANNAPNPQPAAITALRNATNNALGQNREIYANAGNRAMLGEELKTMFVLHHAGWHDAIKKGTTKAYSDKIVGQYASTFGQNLRELKLDSKGLHK